ncbi:MAG: hypothetical protein AVDCRST_MAG76-1561, partial [uncultured Acidimicrobiales bacterium]
GPERGPPRPQLRPAPAPVGDRAGRRAGRLPAPPGPAARGDRRRRLGSGDLRRPRLAVRPTDPPPRGPTGPRGRLRKGQGRDHRGSGRHPRAGRAGRRRRAIRVDGAGAHGLAARRRRPGPAPELLRPHALARPLGHGPFAAQPGLWRRLPGDARRPPVPIPRRRRLRRRLPVREPRADPHHRGGRRHRAGPPGPLRPSAALDHTPLLVATGAPGVRRLRAATAHDVRAHHPAARGVARRRAALEGAPGRGCADGGGGGGRSPQSRRDPGLPDHLVAAGAGLGERAGRVLLAGGGQPPDPRRRPLRRRRAGQVSQLPPRAAPPPGPVVTV